MSIHTFDIARLERLAANRRPTYMAEARACGKLVKDGTALAFDTESECAKKLWAAKGAVRPARPSPQTWETKGPLLWAEFHARAVNGNDPPDAKQELAWLARFKSRLGCGGDCGIHFAEMMRRTPPDFTSRESYFVWGVNRHNEVNRKLSKPEMSIEDARAKWKDS